MSKWHSVLSGLVVMLLLIVPLVGLAQDETQDETSDLALVTDEYEYVSISHPADWQTRLDNDNPTSLYLVNTEAGLERLTGETSTPFEPGDQALVITSFPVSALELLDVAVADDVTVAEFGAALAGVFVTATDTGTTLGESVVMELASGREIAVVPYRSEAQALEGAFLVYRQDDLVTLALLGAYTESYTPALEALGLAMLDSYQVTISAEELYALLFEVAVEVEADVDLEPAEDEAGLEADVDLVATEEASD